MHCKTQARQFDRVRRLLYDIPMSENDPCFYMVMISSIDLSTSTTLVYSAQDMIPSRSDRTIGHKEGRCRTEAWLAVSILASSALDLHDMLYVNAEKKAGMSEEGPGRV